jgi:serine protease AprX
LNGNRLDAEAMARNFRALALVLAWIVALPTLPIAHAGVETPARGIEVDGPSIFGDTTHILRMKAGSFDPAFDPVPAPAGLLSSLLPAGGIASDGRVRFILQFDNGVNPALIEHLRARGIAYEAYLPDGAMIASALPRDLPLTPASIGARALLPLHPAFKLDPGLWQDALAPGAQSVRLAVLTFDTPQAQAAVSRFATALVSDGRIAFVDCAAAAILPLAASPDVQWVEPFVPRVPLLNYTTRIVAARQDTDGAFVPGGNDVWSYNNATGNFEGLTGKGVTINIADTGIDGTHPAFAGRIVAALGYGGNATCDCTPGQFPHGTMVAGVAAGNGSWRAADADRQSGKFAGVAPDASLVAQEIFGALRTPSQLSQDAYYAGAFVNSNSWGGNADGSYTLDSQEYDQNVVDANGRDTGAPQMVYVFAAGNAGSGAQTVGTPATAKNVISVGSIGDIRWSSPDEISGFSSRGPTADGRLKPDLVAPGDGVDSARAASAGCGGGEDGCSYWTASGTSFSTPAVSGASAIATQWYRDRNGAAPSAAMVKALLILGATPLPGLPWPDNNQGWGRLNVSRTVNEDPSFRHVTWDESTALSTAAGRANATFRFFAEAGQELRIVLVWSDVPGTASSAKTLINDLDLEARAPDGTLLVGNAFSNGFSAANGTRDSTNNTEVIRVHAPARGAWTITVHASTVPSGDQRFALAVSGNVTSSWVSLSPAAPEFTPNAPREDDPLTVVVPVFNTGTLYPGNFEVVATLSGPEGNVSATAQVLNIRPGDDFPATFTFAPKRGAHTLRVVVDPGGLTGDRVTSDNTLSGAVFVAGYEVAMLPVRTFAGLLPQGSDTFVVALTNLGNVNDTEFLAGQAGPGWSLSLNASSASLPPGATSFFSGTLTAPDRAVAGTVSHVDVSASSAGNSSRMASLSFDVNITSAPASRVLQGPIAATVGPGETARFGFAIENTGNVPLSIDLSTSFVPAVPAGFALSPSNASLAMPAYSASNLTVEASVPPGALASAYRAIVVRVTSREEGTTVEILYQLAVRRTTGISLGELPPPESGRPGETLRFPFVVRNQGNARETYTISLSGATGASQGVYFGVENATMTLDAFSQGFATGLADLRSFAAQGTFNSTVEVRATSGAVARANLEAHVEAVHAIAVDGPARLTVRQGGTAVLRASIQNLGNVGEAISLTAENVPLGLTVSLGGGTLTVAAGDTGAVEVRVAGAANAAVGLSTLRLTAASAAGGDLVPASLNVTVSVQAAPAAANSFLAAPGPAPLAAAVVALALWSRKRRRGAE